MSANPVEIPVERSQTTSQSDPAQHLLQISFGYIISSALWVAAELGVADLLQAGPAPVANLAVKTESDEDALYRVLRLLAMVGVFAETQSRHFALTPAAELLRSGAASSLRDTVIWLADPFHFEVAADLLHSVRTGQPTIEHLKGKPAFEYFPTDRVENERFNNAMTDLSALAIPSVLEVYDFSAFSMVVDVAGGHGYLLCEILRTNPGTQGVLFDLEHVLSGGQQRISELGLAQRCRTVVGDFFKAVPEGGDLYIMKSIIHDWDDERALVILGNCRHALGAKRNGKLVLLEMVVPLGNQPHPVKVIDIEMLFFPGGRERTEREYRELLAQGGFRLTRIIPTKSPFSVIEAEVAS
jgi:hypothetical protein